MGEITREERGLHGHGKEAAREEEGLRRRGEEVERRCIRGKKERFSCGQGRKRETEGGGTAGTGPGGDAILCENTKTIPLKRSIRGKGPALIILMTQLFDD